MARRIEFALEPLKTWFYLFLWLLFFLHKTLEYTHFAPVFFRSFLDDLLVVPLVLPFVLSFLRLVFYNQIYFLNRFMVFSFVVALSVVFELVLPHYSTRYTADLWDVLFYALGGMVYWKYQYYLGLPQKQQKY